MDQFPPTSGYPQQPQQPNQPQIIVTQAPSQPKSKFWSRLLFSFLIMCLFGSIAMNTALMGALAVLGFGGDADGRVYEKFVSHNRLARDKVAILSIEGTILSGEGFFRQQIDRAQKDLADGSLKAIVVRVNSPGGTISGSDYMLHHLRKLADEHHVPMVVSMGAVAASGGYYVSMCVGDKPDTIFAEPSTWTGSIGVVIPHYNVADLMQKWGIENDPIASHRLKTIGSIARKMTDEERQILQKLVDDGFTQFKDVIKAGRPKFKEDSSALDKLATGQIFDAHQAVKDGLVDKIGFVEDAVDRAIKLAHLDKENVKVVKYKAEPKLSDLIFGETRVRQSYDLAALLETTTPRGYYLCSWLPTLVTAGDK